MAAKYTFKQFQSQYPDDDACLRAILERRYGAAEACPNCGVVGILTRIEGRRAFACKEGCHIYPCAGTVFEKSPTYLTLWFHAMYLMTATRNGVSAKELQRQLGVTYKCAWRIGHQLRELMAARDEATTPSKLSGHVEVDETYVGGKINHRKGKRLDNKAVVFGSVDQNRLTYPPNVNTAPPPPKDTDDGEKKGRGAGSGGGGGSSDLPPFIQGLLAKLPQPDAEWPVAARAKWLETASNIFDLMYQTPTDDSSKYIEVKVSTI